MNSDQLNHLDKLTSSEHVTKQESRIKDSPLNKFLAAKPKKITVDVHGNNALSVTT
jgi:hypothetical protein